MATASEDLLKRITARPDVFNGKPIIRDMRISVELILSLLSQGASHEELMDDYPDLEEEDILACIAYAHAVIAGDSSGAGIGGIGMNFLVDRCAGRRLTQWLQSQGHDALDARELGPDPEDRALLERAVSENRILITMDKDFGELIHLHGRPHTGLIRLPEVRMAQRITLVEDLILNHRQALEERAIITVTNSRIRISRQQLR